jgi:hypothetical protein
MRSDDKCDGDETVGIGDVVATATAARAITASVTRGTSSRLQFNRFRDHLPSTEFWKLAIPLSLVFLSHQTTVDGGESYIATTLISTPTQKSDHRG